MEASIRELISHYVDETDYDVDSVPFGITNLTKLIRLADKKLIARIYDPQTKDKSRLKFEIELTSYLQQCALTFDVPSFVASKTGSKFVELSGNYLGAVVHYIEGVTPDPNRLAHAQAMGRTVGQLSKALSLFEPSEIPQDLIFHELDSLHPLSGTQAIHSFITEPPFHLDTNGIVYVQQLLEEVKKLRGELDALPKQIVHHDLLIFNLLINNDQMSGVLDFDFASWDVRALDLAVCLNHLLQCSGDSFVHVESFLEQYARYVNLTSNEIDMLPLLMRIYYVALLTIYIGQYASGKDVHSAFKFILDQLCKRTTWLELNGDSLVRLVYTTMNRA